MMTTLTQPNDVRHLNETTHNPILPQVAMLPLDTIIKILSSIPDSRDVFALLDTLRPHTALGPLEDLYQLGLTHDHSSLWPTLTLDSSKNDTLSIALCESTVKHYSQVLVDDPWYPVDRLKNYLNPTSSIEWNAKEFPVTIENINNWADLRITRFYLLIKSDTPQLWKQVLPRLHSLKSLRIDDLFGDLGDVYSIVAKSVQITELEIYPMDFRLGNAELLHLIQWFRRQPFRIYADWFMDWGLLDYNLKQELCDVMFNCPTLDRLTLTGCYVGDMDFSNFSFSMNTLEMYEFSFWIDLMKLLASRLKESKLTNLVLVGNLIDDSIDGVDETDYIRDVSYIDGMECLLNVLPLTSIKSLDISGLYVSVDAWCSLITLIFPPNCHLEILTTDFTFHEAHPKIVQTLALSIQKNQTLSEIHLFDCKISIPDMR
ncbi:hypothetical protein AeMF1_012132 [Aphanomyces euteiches]|nr:hypothetical protein AeMF1_012132 [Aphanomyces euteiches]